jgi:hypothetical protein
LDAYGSSAYPAWGELGDPDKPVDSVGLLAAYSELVVNILMEFDYVRSASGGRDYWTA